jgi:hypothetical protein
VCAHSSSQQNPDYAGRLQSILESRNLTLHQVSRRSEILYGRSSAYFLPHNLYYDLRLPTFSPSIHQLIALSRISNYRLTDWFRVFDFHVEEIPRLQLLTPPTRTVLLNSGVEDQNAWMPWLEERTSLGPTSSVAPLPQLVWVSHWRRLGSISKIGNENLYARIGREDALAFPELVPGSIVRINPGVGSEPARKNGTISQQIFLIEHSRGLYCCRLRVADNDLVVPVSSLLSYAQVEFRLSREAQVLGVVDLEIRPEIDHPQPEVPDDLASYWKPTPLMPQVKLGSLLRNGRRRMNLSLCEASDLSRRVSGSLQDQRYFISQSSLCDYEVLDTPPRHFQKIVTLSVIYGLNFHKLLAAVGVNIDGAGAEFMPDHLAARLQPAGLDVVAGRDESNVGDFLGEFQREWGEVPLFLRTSLGTVSGLAEVSLGDVFWTGGEQTPLHPDLQNAAVVFVNRRRRKPVHFRSKPPWQQPLYVVLKRDGTYLCACCSMENDTLVVHPYSQTLYRPTRLRLHHDAEVVGQIVTIARKMARS